MHTKRVTLFLPAIALAGCYLHGAVIAAPTPMILAEGGGTDYVLTGNPDESDIELALGELAEHLKVATGADFRMVTVAEAGKLSRRIVVGDNALSRSILGEAIISSLKPQENLVTVKGQDVVLVGGSPRASLYAAYSFLENEVGCRWYAVYLDPVIPNHDRLIVAEITRREQPAFSHRYAGFKSPSDVRQGELFFLRHRMTNIQPRGKIDPGAHTLFYYVPPHDREESYHFWGWPPRSNLFETHPEYFSMTPSGQRVDNLQLCFSNPELRKVLTSQIYAVISKSEYRDHGYIALDANDVPGKFCHCAACLKLEEQYDNIGGPLYDYLLELSGFLKREYPGVAVKTLAYRKKQTEFPPKIDKLPDNIIIHFAPIDDNFATALDHPTNRETLNNLKRWCEIADTVWVWYYTNPYFTAGPPFSSMRCAIDDLRTMHEIGVRGVTFQWTTGTTDKQRGLNLADLQAWLLMKLSYDPQLDADALIDEFMEHYYGEAAPWMEEYLAELESHREAMKIRLPWLPSSHMLGYLTPEMLARWQETFDEMEDLTADSPDALRHVRTARITLDNATLQKWHLLGEPRAGLGVTPRKLADRILQNMTVEIETRCREDRVAWCWGPFEKRVDGLLLRAQATLKPLPEMFTAFPSDQVREILPEMSAMKEDADAASGLAIVRDEKLDSPVTFGLYNDHEEKPILSQTIQHEEIKPDRYSVYKVGRAALTPQCRLWMTDAWLFTIPLEEAYVEGDPFVEWDIYASLKFVGPKYGSEDKVQPNRISCDRVVLVRAGGEEE
jgi:hypothetical protein